jgi:CRISPR type IV-associated protein Csf1
MTSTLPCRYLSGSAVYRRAAGIQPVGAPLKRSATCALCGSALLAGEPAAPLKNTTFDEGFNNKLDVHTRGTVVCGDCEALWAPEFLQKYSSTYAAAQGVFKLSSNEDIQAFILTPPPPPSIAVFSTRKMQHMIWRTPVCLSAQRLIVRVDDDVLHIDRAKVLAGIRGWQHCEARMNALGIKGAVAFMRQKLDARLIGSMRADVARAVAAESAEGAAAVASLHALRMGEWWAVGACRGVDLDRPETWPHPVKLLPV